jgi:hypothetical protein
LDSLPGLTQGCQGWWTAAVWQAPSTAYEAKLTTRTLSKREVGALRTIASSEISNVTFDHVNRPPYALSKPDSFALYIRMAMGKLPLCKTPPAAIRTLTPEVCTGPQGETQWSRPTTGYVFVRGLREGQCRLQAGLDGQKWFGTFSLDLFFVSGKPDTSWEYAGYGNPCAAEGATTCAFGLSDVAICRDKRWSTYRDCTENQICEFVSASGAGSQAACRGLRAP